MRFKKLIAPVALLVVLSSNCDEELENEISANGQTMALTGEGRLAIANEQPPEPADDEDLKGPLELTWVGIEGSETAGLTELVLRVKNNLAVDVKAKADIICEAFLGRKGSRPLTPNAINLAPAEEGFFSIRAKKLPLQNIEGATSFYVWIDVKIKDPKSGEVDKAQATRQLFYRHAVDYESIDVFDEHTLIEKHGGVITEQVEQAAALKFGGERRIVGRVLDINDEITELTDMDLIKKSIDVEGNEHGVVTGMWLEVGGEAAPIEEGEDENN